jgi:8-oxo-dGTP diphosphatase
MTAAVSGLAACAVVWRGDEVLLVRAHRPEDGPPVWFLPGGRVDEGELAHEAVVREVREETGIELAEVDRLLFVSQHELTDDPRWAGLFTAFTFEAHVPDDAEPTAKDPEGVVTDAVFVPRDEAVSRLARLDFGPMRDPVLAYLEGRTPGPCLWLWRFSVDDAEHEPLLVIPG